MFLSHIESIIEDGIEAGQFDDVETIPVAEFLLATIHGCLVRRSTTDGDVDGTAVRQEIDESLGERLGLNGDKADTDIGNI